MPKPLCGRQLPRVAASPLLRVILILALISSAVLAQKAEPGETHWPGITAAIYTIIRLPDNRVAVRFIYEAALNAPKLTFIADRPVANFDPDVDEVAKVDRNVFHPYSIEKGGRLIDESTGISYPAANLNAGDQADPGNSETLEILQPGGTFFLGGVFQCPPVNQDKPPKVQRVSFELPGLVKPIRGIPLPRQENEVVCFFPKPRVLSRPTPPPQ